MPPAFLSGRHATAIASRIVIVTSALAVSIGTASSCASPREGERCNSDLSHDECASHLTCTIPTNCSYAVCCPAAGTSSNPACSACPIEGDGEPDATAAEGPRDPDDSGSDASDGAIAADGSR